MTTILMNLDDQYGTDWKQFASKEEWDAYKFSAAGYNRAYNDHNYGAGNHAYGGPLKRASQEPLSFPCIMLEGNYRSDSYGPDEIEVVFLYNVKIIDEGSISFAEQMAAVVAPFSEDGKTWKVIMFGKILNHTFQSAEVAREFIRASFNQG